ncbi:MAG TPA: hypothetical protein VI387_06600 [Candidatus Brocadiales bacterium]|nr:hypothetical protein [Candidatus Brocadiales bacterium]
METITITQERTATKTQPKVFESRLAVFRVKANFIAPYRKCKYVYLDANKLKTKASFIKHLSHITPSWPTGGFYLKLSDGRVFSRFDVVSGKIHKFYKESPITGKPYPIIAWWK